MTTAMAAAPAAPRAPMLPRSTAMALADGEYRRFTALVRDLVADDWQRPTACPAWDVHAMVCHVLGMAEFAASPIVAVRQLRAAGRSAGLFIDALTDLQRRRHEDRTPAELVARLEAVGPRAARGRRRLPAVIRNRTLADQPVDETGGQTEPWRMGYLSDVILTRDTWMHRSDIALATGRAMVLTAEHDAVLVADVAAEWAARHGQPCTLTLTSPAGGRWSFGHDGPAYEIDAVEFCRLLSGRGLGEGLLATRVPF